MKALSIKQPWAWLIVNGYKNVENRTWATEFRGRVYVHAGVKLDYGALEGDPAYRILDSWITSRLHPADRSQFTMDFRSTWLGAIVGEVDIVDCVTRSASPWFEGTYGFLLRNPVAYAPPIPYRGRLGFFDVTLQEAHHDNPA